jgi:hypothetical protein
MDAQERISQELDELLTRGQALIRTCGFHKGRYQTNPDDLTFRAYKTESINLVRRACGDDSDHYRELRSLADDPHRGNQGYYLHLYVGVVQAALRDFERGRLFDLRALVAADLLGDFIDQAQHLLAAGYRNPAASLAGAVLEDMLRRLSGKHSISFPDKTNIEALNVGLAKAGVYSKLVQKRVTALADIRNNADHGHFEEFREADVADMIEWLRRFGADYLR